MFCPYFSPFSLPLQDMTLAQQTKKKLSWTDEQSRVFQTLKDAMADSVALSPILPDEPIEIATDAAKYACSALLWQRCPTSGETRYLTATSRILQQTEVNWSVIRKEVAAILMAVGQNAYFLAGARKITVYCDSKAVSFLRGTKQSTPILWRFAQVISQFDLEVIHIKGEDNFLADYLSRSIFPADMPSNFTPK